MAIAVPPDKSCTTIIGTERRTNIHLRVVFDNACRITEPFFDSEPGMVGVSNLTLFARQTLHDAYPELTDQDIALLFAGVQGFHVARLKQHQERA
jgi:hypothetical protein